MRFGSLFAGIGGFDLGFERAGMQAVWQVEIADHPTQILEKHWPDVQRYRDVKDVGKRNLETVDLICGGFPCQDVSVAGNRKGLDGERSGLWLEFHRILDEMRPQWVIVENVPGLLSSNEGRDFAVIIRGLVELRYGVAWRILDAQNFGVAQRRRRVFIVGHIGDGRAAEILFEPAGMSRNTKSGRATREEIAGTIGARIARSHTELDGHGAYVASIQHAQLGRKDDAGPQGKGWRDDGKSWTLDGRGEADVIAFDYALQGSERTYIHRQRGYAQLQASRPDAIAFSAGQSRCLRMRDGKEGGRQGPLLSEEKSLTLAASNDQALFTTGVRRLTPTEYERLQGFPDGWTEGLSDSARYRGLGNAVCEPVAEWIGGRIITFEKGI